MAECKDCLHKKVCFKQTIRKDLTPKGFELNCDNFISKECAEVVRCKDCRYWQDNNGGILTKNVGGVKKKHPMKMTFAVTEKGKNNVNKHS